MSKINKAFDFRMKSNDPESGIFEGYASIFNNIDSYGDIVLPGAFTKSLKEIKAAGNKIPVLFNHKTDLASHIGAVLEAHEDERGLFVRCQLDINDPNGLKAYNLIKARRVKDMSFAFSVEKGDPAVRDGDPVFEISQVKLYEVSIVLIGANPAAGITSVKSAGAGMRSIMSPAEVEVRKKNATDGTSLAAAILESNTNEGKDLAYMKALAGVVKGTTKMNVATKAGLFIDAKTAKEIEDAAAEGVLARSAGSGTGLTSVDKKNLETIKEVSDRLAADRKSQALIASIGSIKGLEPDNHSYTSKGTTMNNRIYAPTDVKARGFVADRAIDALLQKSGIGNTGSIIAPIATTEDSVLGIEGSARSLLDVVPVGISHPTFSYLRQTVRNLNATVVPEGKKKPESDFGFARYSGNLLPVAHIVAGIDEYILEDLPSLRDFIAYEMVSGVWDAAEAWLFNVLAGVTTDPVAFKEDGFTTARMAKARLQALQFSPAGFILNPEDWAIMETAKASGSGSFLFNSAPVDQSNGLLWGVPVTTSPRVPIGNGFIIADNSVGLLTDGNMKMNWAPTGEDFSYNRTTFRVESRFAPTVLRSAGVVQMLLTDSAVAIKPKGDEFGDPAKLVKSTGDSEEESE